MCSDQSEHVCCFQSTNQEQNGHELKPDLGALVMLLRRWFGCGFGCFLCGCSCGNDCDFVAVVIVLCLSLLDL